MGQHRIQKRQLLLSKGYRRIKSQYSCIKSHQLGACWSLGSVHYLTQCALMLVEVLHKGSYLKQATKKEYEYREYKVVSLEL